MWNWEINSLLPGFLSRLLFESIGIWQEWGLQFAQKYARKNLISIIRRIFWRQFRNNLKLYLYRRLLCLKEDRKLEDRLIRWQLERGCQHECHHYDAVVVVSIWRQMYVKLYTDINLRQLLFIKSVNGLEFCFVMVP